MPEWLIGALVPVAGAAVVGLTAALMKRYPLYEKCYKFGLYLRELGLGFDLPIIAGEAENSFKKRVLSFICDAARGLARGLAGKPLEEDA
ncbi:MAG: hypothetical protein FJY65_03595 [Calditrichaeota bacterium]|nr:hypothetical protein [Calditrichota bacterium]